MKIDTKNKTLTGLLMLLSLIAIILLWLKVDTKGHLLHGVVLIGAISGIISFFMTSDKSNQIIVSKFLLSLFVMACVIIHFIFNIKVVYFIAASFFFYLYADRKHKKSITRNPS